MYKTLLIILFAFPSFAQKDSVIVYGNVLITNNGIDPVPAFALGKSAVMANLFIAKRHFIYNAQVNYSLDLKPWAQNHWFLWKIPYNEKSNFRVGTGISFFHKRDNIDYLNRKNEEMQITNQYLMFELSYWYRFSANRTLQFIYWQDKGLSWDGLKYGSFFSVSANINKVRLGKNPYINFNPNLFYLTNTAPQHGLYFSETTTLAFKNLPVNLFVQNVFPITKSPQISYLWNYGVKYSF